MEYCHLGDISQCYPNPLPETVTRCICEQLLEALAILHELGITHRDVKPQVISLPK
jgi:serine/threonine protein kinase